MNSSTQARLAIQNMLQGISPNEGDYGDWSHVIKSLREALNTGGATGVHIAFQAAARADENLAALVAAPSTTSSAPRMRSMPALPDEVAAILDHPYEPCAMWLDDYISYASQASPVTPPRFHEAAGLFAVATTIARRLVFRVAETSYYPNLYVLFVAPPGFYAKSTGLKVLERLIRRASLGHLLLPESNTPQSLMQQLSLTIPDKLDSYSEYDRAQWLKARAQASKRGWMLDEAGFLFGELKKDYMAALLGLLLKLYDNPDDGLTYETISHGRMTIRDASLSFFGATTPRSIETYLREEKLWEEGLWSRFALIVPDRKPVYASFNEETTMPLELVQGLTRIDALFPKPNAQIIEDDDERKLPYVKVWGEEPPSSLSISREVFQAWIQYDKAIRFDLPSSDAIEDTLIPSYVRFPSQVLRVAMILATMDCEEVPVRLEMRHLRRAISIVEGWRADLHAIWSDGIKSSETRLGDRILSVLAETAPVGVTVRDLCQRTRHPAKEIKEILEVLRLAGQVSMVETYTANGRAIQVWSLTP